MRERAQRPARVDSDPSPEPVVLRLSTIFWGRPPSVDPPPAADVCQPARRPARVDCDTSPEPVVLRLATILRGRPPCVDPPPAANVCQPAQRPARVDSDTSPEPVVLRLSTILRGRLPCVDPLHAADVSERASPAPGAGWLGHVSRTRSSTVIYNFTGSRSVRGSASRCRRLWESEPSARRGWIRTRLQDP